MMLTSEKPNSDSKNLYMTLLNFKTFVDQTRDHLILGGAFEHNSFFWEGVEFQEANLHNPNTQGVAWEEDIEASN